MILNKLNLHKISGEGLSIPSVNIFELPEKVLQFGTGVLLRGLPDYYIDQSNKQNVFNGRIVVVKSTSSGKTDEFENQDYLYTHCIKGLKNGIEVNKKIINASISRVLNASNQWNLILDTAENPAVQIIISNTTELGIVLDPNDSILNNPPKSFPGKLLAWLYKRYTIFNGSIESGVTIIPTELITENGSKLKNIIQELAIANKLNNQFINWLLNANDFCNSLVDRIVPGKMPLEQHKKTLKHLKYEDELMIMSESYSLWAIETSSEKSKNILNFGSENEGVYLTSNIQKFQEMKLRLLNGSHSFSCALAFLAGFETVSSAMQNKKFRDFLRDLIIYDINKCVFNNQISEEELLAFTNNVLDRFSNNQLQHKWLSISVNYTGKMITRNIPLIKEYYKRYNSVPKYMAAGFAAYLLFMKSCITRNNSYYGLRDDVEYLIDDEKAIFFFEAWKQEHIGEVVNTILANKNLWGINLSSLNGFGETVTNFLLNFLEGNFLNALPVTINFNQKVEVE